MGTAGLTEVVARLRHRVAAAGGKVGGGISRINARLTRGAGSPRALIGYLGLVTTAITMLAPPATYAVIGMLQLHQRAEEQATLGARHIEIQLARQSAADWLNQVSISVLSATRRSDSVVVASWVTAGDGTVVMFQGASAAWPELRARKPIRTPQFTGQFHIAVSTREVLVATIYVALGFFMLGLAAYYCFRRLPLAGLDRAQRLLDAKQSELLSQKRQLEVQNLRFDAALNNMSQGLCMCDREHRLVVCNAPYVRMYGLAPELAEPGTPFEDIVRFRLAKGLHPEQSSGEYLRDLREIVAARRPVASIRQLGDGRVIAIKHQPMPDGGWVSTHEDMTEHRRFEARITHMSQHDILTELPNRMLLGARLERALEAPQEGSRKARSLAVLSVDIDRFKDVNDALGHAAGDALLKAIAERLQGCIADGDTLARLGADEFCIVQTAPEQPVAATALAARVAEVIGRPFDLAGHQVTVGASIGIAVSPGDGIARSELLKNADLALSRAKSDARGSHRFFEQHMDAEMRARSRLQLDLRKALVNGEFELHYQPLVNLARDEICGFEALLRWRHPGRGLVSPAEFIPLAEETGLVAPIGEWAMRQACAAAGRWPEHVKVAINLSAIQFNSPRLVDTVFSALAASGLSPRRLELEVTESVLLKNNAATLDTLHRLRALGVRIALDDFGTGYSSLSYLRSFPFDKIKIDRCFVSDLSDAREDALAILRAVAGLGTSLGIATTAEGVETREQLERVRAEGCTEMQGFFFSPPRPLGELEGLLRTHRPIQAQARASAA
jgi:diguanylate cyclase (GGDEF)-like protein